MLFTTHNNYLVTKIQQLTIEFFYFFATTQNINHRSVRYLFGTYWVVTVFFIKLIYSLGCYHFATTYELSHLSKNTLRLVYFGHARSKSL